MTAKFIPAALLVAALGCAESTTTTPAPNAPKQTQAAHPSRAPRELRSAGIAQSMHPLTNGDPMIASTAANRTKEGGVALTGPDKAYLERVDNSGWSGRSAPPESTGVGGGPAPLQDLTVDATNTTNTTNTTSDEKPATQEAIAPSGDDNPYTE